MVDLDPFFPVVLFWHSHACFSLYVLVCPDYKKTVVCCEYLHNWLCFVVCCSLLSVSLSLIFALFCCLLAVVVLLLLLLLLLLLCHGHQRRKKARWFRWVLSGVLDLGEL